MMNKLIVGVITCIAASTMALAQDVVKIGVSAIQSGPMADYGSYYNNGVKVAVQQLNEEGGIMLNGKRSKVEAVFCDSQGDSAKAAICGRRLSSDPAIGVIIAATSIETFPILGFNTAPDRQFLMISSSASNKLAELNNRLVARYWFNTYTYMPSVTKRFAQVFTGAGRKLPVIAVMESEDEFGKAWTSTFKGGWESAGGKMGTISSFAIGTTDFFPQLSAVLRNKPDIIATPFVCSVIGPMMKQARQLGFKGEFIIDLNCAPEELEKFVDKETFEGSYFWGSQWNLDTASILKFKKNYRESIKSEPTAISADGYGQFMWAARSIETAQSSNDPNKIRAALAKTLSGEWNLLGIKDLQPNGETSAFVFPRRFDKGAKMINYN